MLEDKGVLTAEEFVCAGDHLIYKCPTWSWSAGDLSSRKPYLPRQKQFLVTRGVPCLKRVATLQAEYVAETELSHSDGEGWLECHSQRVGGVDEIGEFGSGALNCSHKKPAHLCGDAGRIINVVDVNDAEYEDMATFESGDGCEDASTLEGCASANNVVRTRTYDLSITYDKYYQARLLWF